MNRIKHSFNCGDLLTVLPALRKLYGSDLETFTIYQRINFPAFYYDGAVHPTKFNGQDVCMNEQMFGLLKPLLEHQAYIKSFEVWNGEDVDYDLDKSRDMKSIPMPYGDIHYWINFVYPKLVPCFENASLHISDYDKEYELEYENKIVINITERYRNPYISYFFLKKYEADIIFAGTEKEHKLFTETFNLNVLLLTVKDFLELAKVIDNCKLFIGNQSMAWHIADKLQTTRLLEFCPQFPNTYPTSSNGYIFAYQENLQYYFNKLINK